jgi:hypothetical protein
MAKKKNQLTLMGNSALPPEGDSAAGSRVARNRRVSPQERRLLLLAHCLADLARTAGHEGWVDVLDDEFELSETLSATRPEVE